MGSLCGKLFQGGADVTDGDNDSVQSTTGLLDNARGHKIMAIISQLQPIPDPPPVISAEAPNNESNTASPEGDDDKRLTKKKELRQFIQRTMIVALDNNRVLQSQKEVHINQDLLQGLLQNLQISHRHDVPYGKAYKLEVADDNTRGFVMCQFSNRKFNQFYMITDIVRIWNPYLILQYAMKKIEYADKLKEQYLFHGTNVPGALGVCANNFDWRKVQNMKFGRGVSFANNPWFASHYSKKRHQGNTDYVMILAKVLIEDDQLSVGDTDTVVPTAGHTTTNHKGEVLVKYDDASFYPEFIVYFRERILFPYQPSIWAYQTRFY